MTEARPGRRDPMQPVESRAAWSVASLLGLRMLGFFMVLPVFALYAHEYGDATPTSVGLAIGIYGLTQALFQIPLGLLSDRIGRKRVIGIGLVMLIVGSVIAAMADHIAWVIAGRALQGLGAISGAALALAADLTREHQRTRVMAIIGISIGASFALATVLGPAITSIAGMSGVFWATALLAAAGMALLWFIVPEPPAGGDLHRNVRPVFSDLRAVLSDRRLLLLDAGICLLHFVMPATFVVLPLELRDLGGVAPEDQWMLYPPVLLLAIIAMWPGVKMADRRNRPRAALLGATACLLVAELAFAARLDGGWLWLAICMVAFFAAFTVIESVLPALVSRIAPANMKGAALGAFSTAQYLGAFLGGALAGLMHEHFGTSAVFVACALVCLAWLVLAMRLDTPAALSLRTVPVGELTGSQARALAKRLLSVPGVAEAVVVAEQHLAYVKVDRQQVDSAALDAIAEGQT